MALPFSPNEEKSQQSGLNNFLLIWLKLPYQFCQRSIENGQKKTGSDTGDPRAGGIIREVLEQSDTEFGLESTFYRCFLLLSRRTENGTKNDNCTVLNRYLVDKSAI